MLKLMADYNVMFYVMGIVAVVGICSKMISQFTLKRLVRASSNMNKSTHKLMKLMRAKYEHACMASDRVQNVKAFVDKYIYEYRILGLNLHTWKYMQKQAMWICMMLGIAGAGIYYRVYGMGEAVYRNAGTGAILMTLLFVLQLTADDRYQLKTAEVYIIDYLENVCAHRYEKMYRKETEPAVEVSPVMEAEASETEKQLKESFSDLEREMEKEIEKEIEKETEPQAETEEKAGRESMIRDILEEFLAQRT